MIRHRQSLKSKPALSHRKSTSSTRSVILEHLDPAVAQRDAQTAAHQAFARAQDRSGAEMALFPPPRSPAPRRKPHTSGAATRNEGGDVRVDVGNTPSIPRRQSVRFVGPCTVQNRGSASKQRPHTPASAFRGAVDPANIAESPDGQSFNVPVLHESPVRPGTSTSTYSSKVADNYLQSLALQENLYTPEDDIASVPSSYRRLRRSKSLHPSRVTGHARDSVDSYLLPGTGPTREVRTSMSMRTLKSSQVKENVKPQKAPTLKAPKSMSFLKNRRGRISSITSHDSVPIPQANPDAGQLPLRKKTSSFFGSKNRRAESGLRKTLRSSESNAELEHTPSADTGLSLPKGTRGSLRIKARKASKTLKSKLFNLFSSTKGDDEAVFPDQHVKSQKKHTASEFSSDVTGPNEHENQGNGNQGPLHYNHSNSSDVFSAPQNTRVCSRKASLPGFRDRVWEQGSNEKALQDKSRVTSWTDSGPSTLTSEQQLAWKEWEKQRLSIIKENGAHCPSPSLRRQAIGKHILQSQESLVGQPILPGPTVDSQRVYAALMERLAETTQLAQVVDQQGRSLGEATPTILRMSSRAEFEEYEDNGAKPAPLTVRRATSKESLTVGDSDPNLSEDASFNRPADGDILSPPVTLAPWNGIHGPANGQGVASAERTNAFFGSPEAHLFRTISPYRRALRKSMDEAQDDMRGRNSGDRIISEYGTEIRRPDDALYEDTYSESVYSSDEQAAGPATNPMMSLIEVVQGPPSSTGNMSMSVDPPVTYRPTGHRIVSSVSSIDWKTWLSANVARLEPSPSPPRIGDVNFTQPGMPNSYGQGHVREGAQIDEDEVLGSPHRDIPAVHKPTLPISPLMTLQSNNSKTPGAQKTISVATPPTAGVLAETDNQKFLSKRREPFNTPLPSPELPPPIPLRSPLRKNPYPTLANDKSTSEVRGEVSRPTTRNGYQPPTNMLPVTRSREMNDAGSPQTPTPKPTRLQKKRSGFIYTPSVAASSQGTSPGLTAAVEKQFGPPTRQTTLSGENKENEVSGDLHGMQKAGLTTSANEERSAKGRRMVEVLLGSRRKRMASSETDSPAFL